MARTTLEAFLATCPNIDTVRSGGGRASMEKFIAWVAESIPASTITGVGHLRGSPCATLKQSFCTTTVPDDPSTYPLITRMGQAGRIPVHACGIGDRRGRLVPDVRKVVDNIGLFDAWAAGGAIDPQPRADHPAAKFT